MKKDGQKERKEASNKKERKGKRIDGRKKKEWNEERKERKKLRNKKKRNGKMIEGRKKEWRKERTKEEIRKESK